jgi:hypothetical protein
MTPIASRHRTDMQPLPDRNLLAGPIEGGDYRWRRNPMLEANPSRPNPMTRPRLAHEL